MSKIILLLVLVFLCGLASSMADLSIPVPVPIPRTNYAQMSTAKKFRIVSPSRSLFIFNAPYHEDTDGEYELLEDSMNGYAVYQKTDGSGIQWNFYRQSNGKWYLDFDDADETWNGTVMYSTTPGLTPESLEYLNNGFVITSKTIVTRNLPYCNGEYVFEGEIYNNAPVYRGTCNFPNYVFKMYRRNDGNWYVAYNYVGEEWTGTVAYTLSPAVEPSEAEWNH